MITVSMATVIGATRERVWRALTRPQEMLRWDERFLALQDTNGSARATHWRFRLGSVPVDLCIRPTEVISESRLRSEVSLGLFRFDATCILTSDGEDPERTHVSLRFTTSNAVPVVGGTLDRFDVRKLAADLIDQTLRALQRWCESPTGTAARPSSGRAADPGPARPIKYAAPRGPSARGPRSADA
ncbi:MAG: SRPBCC family protein [Myxococcales bacterium]|nr:SRPBCC family protein [Myxococcales bacterium]